MRNSSRVDQPLHLGERIWYAAPIPVPVGTEYLPIRYTRISAATCREVYRWP